MSIGRKASVVLANAILFLAFVLVVVGHAYYDRKWRADFDVVKAGDTEEVILARLGFPTAREKPDRLYPGYAYANCVAPCAERWWYERLIPGIEAWSISLGNDRRVLETYHWVSP